MVSPAVNRYHPSILLQPQYETMLAAILLLVTTAFSTSPLGQDALEWGISEAALMARYNVLKIDPKNPQGQHFTEFMEVDPVVYIDRATPGQKREFYFYDGKLYKTLVIHLNQKNAQAFYKEKVETLAESLGEPSQQLSSMVFNLPVLHTIWDFENEQYDLRFGAGYIYEVRIHTPLAEKKKQRMDGWKFTQNQSHSIESLL